jgi:hypothetical protein
VTSFHSQAHNAFACEAQPFDEHVIPGRSHEVTSSALPILLNRLRLLLVTHMVYIDSISPLDGVCQWCRDEPDAILAFPLSDCRVLSCTGGSL